MKHLDSASRTKLIDNYQSIEFADLSYATVQDYCDSADNLPWLSSINSDLKDAQRPWMVKAILAKLPTGSRVLEVGGGQPFVAGLLAELGYEVYLVDPYDGSGHGPREYEEFKREFKDVQIIREIFDQNTPGLEADSFDAIFSISVLEHVHQPQLDELFSGIHHFLRPGGYSIHAVDHVLEGEMSHFHKQQLVQILHNQTVLNGQSPATCESDFEKLNQTIKEDLETYYLSAAGHNLWRGQTRYQDFPFRKCVSIQSISSKADVSN